MKKILFVLLLTGCSPYHTSEPALVNITCYDKDGKITFAQKDTRGALEIVDDPTKNYRSQKCVIERAE